MMEKSISTSVGFRVQIIASYEEAEPVWRALETTGDALVFQTYDWQATWYRTIGRGQLIRPCLAIIWSADDRPLMLLPLGIVRRGLGRVLIWLGGQLTDYNAPVLAPGIASNLDRKTVETLWQQICRELPPFDYADFLRQPAEIADQENPLRQLSTGDNPLSGCYTRLEPSWTSYHNSKRSGETRRKERRKEGKLGKLGPVEFVIAETAPEIDAIVAKLVAQKSVSYQRKGVKNLFRDPAYADFLRTFTLANAESGLAVLAAIKVQDEIVATQWGLIHNDRFYCLMLSYDHGQFARYSPGNILMRRLLEWCCERQIEIFDFTYGEESYKNHWCEGRLALYDSLLPQTLRGSVLVQAIKWQSDMRQMAKRSAHLYAFATNIRKRWYNALPKANAAANRRDASPENETDPRSEGSRA